MYHFSLISYTRGTSYKLHVSMLKTSLLVAAAASASAFTVSTNAPLVGLSVSKFSLEDQRVRQLLRNIQEYTLTQL